MSEIDHSDHASMAEFLYAGCHELPREEAVKMLSDHLRNRDDVTRRFVGEPLEQRLERCEANAQRWFDLAEAWGSALNKLKNEDALVELIARAVFTEHNLSADDSVAVAKIAMRVVLDRIKGT